MEPELEKGHNLDADPGNKPAQSEGQTATIDEPDKEMSLEALEDLAGQEAGEKPEETKSPAKELAAEPWYKQWNVPGLDSEEKAIQAVNFLRSDYGRIARENAEFRKLSQKSTGTPEETGKEEEIPGLSVFLDKHSIKDANKTVISTDYDAAMKEYIGVFGKDLIARIGETIQETQTSSAKAAKAHADVENLAKEGVLPEYRLPIYDKDGQIVDAGSEFGQQVQGYKGVLEERSAKLPFHLDPEREALVAIFTEGMRSIQEKRTAREATKKRRHPMSENTPPIGSFTHKGKDVNSMTEAEIEDVLTSMESK